METLWLHIRAPFASFSTLRTGTYREVIVNLDMMLGMKADSELISQVRQGLNGESDRTYYGFPFAGDNNFLFDRIDSLEKPLSTHWFVQSDSNLELEPGAVNLTVEIDCVDLRLSWMIITIALYKRAIVFFLVINIIRC